MIGGIIMVLVTLWVYQSGVRAKVDRLLFWVILCALIFLVVQWLAVYFNIALSARGTDVNIDYERAASSIGDRKNSGGFQGLWGSLKSVFFELFPPAVGFLTVAFIRTKLMLKESLSVSNLFSGLKEMFVGIKNSFKTAE